jgi:ribonuclease Z
MMKRKYIIIIAVLFLAVGIGTEVYLSGKNTLDVSLISTAEAAGGKVVSPTGMAPDRYVYYPGTENLAKDEIRLIALGTGMPLARRSQAATCWLVELGNGDKFLFDIGTGANANISALMIPFDFLSRVS